MRDTGRLPGQPRLDLRPPPDDEYLSAVVTAVGQVVTDAGFELTGLGSGWWQDAYSRLHIRAAWTRPPLDDDAPPVLDGVSVWGTGLIRVSTVDQSIELLCNGTGPDTVAAMVAINLAMADLPYR